MLRSSVTATDVNRLAQTFYEAFVESTVPGASQKERIVDGLDAVFARMGIEVVEDDL